MASTLLIAVQPKLSQQFGNCDPVVLQDSLQIVFRKIIAELLSKCTSFMKAATDLAVSEERCRKGMMEEEELETYLYTKTDAIEQVSKEFYNLDIGLRRKVRIYLRNSSDLRHLFPELI